MVTEFPARVLEFIDTLISEDKLDSADLILIRDEIDNFIGYMEYDDDDDRDDDYNDYRDDLDWVL